jgi:hypothetical protein
MSARLINRKQICLRCSRALSIYSSCCEQAHCMHKHELAFAARQPATLDHSQLSSGAGYNAADAVTARYGQCHYHTRVWHLRTHGDHATGVMVTMPQGRW